MSEYQPISSKAKMHPLPTPDNAVSHKTSHPHSENRKRSNNNVFSRMSNMLHISFIHSQQQRARPHNQLYFISKSVYSIKPKVGFKRTLLPTFISQIVKHGWFIFPDRSPCLWPWRHPESYPDVLCSVDPQDAAIV